MSHDRLFKPLSFRTLGNPKATSVDLVFSNIVEASKFVFEFSEDSLQFNEIISTVELLSDTMTTVFANQDHITKREYLRTFGELNGNTRYSVRMRGVSRDGTRTSNYVEMTFVTPQEQLFDGVQYSFDWAKFSWAPGATVTDLELIDVATGEHAIADTKLTPSEIESGEKLVENLKVGTRYRANIYDDGRIRGSLDFKTAGMAGSVSYDVQPGDDIAEILAEFVSLGNTNITVGFSPSETYDIVSLKLPDGINSVVFTAPSGGNNPTLNWEGVSVGTPMDLLSFENVTLRGDFTKRFVDTSVEIKNISFTGCDISDYNCIVRLRNNVMTVENIVVDNCLINNTGGYGVFNVGGVSAKLGGLKVTNTTLTEISTQLMDLRTNADSIIVANCTFYNDEAGIGNFMRFDGNNLPLRITFDKCILSGQNKSTTFNSTYTNYTALSLNFGGSYMTSELYGLIGSRKFTDITQYTGTAHDLFTDPDGRDFSIKEGAGFSGLNSVGDPRWFK